MVMEMKFFLLLDFNKKCMLKLSKKWAKKLISSPESGMGYWIVTIILKNGIQFDKVTIVGGIITQIKKEKNIPFNEEDIAEIIVTNDKSN